MVHAIVAATTSCAMPSVTVSSESCKAGRRPEKAASAHERARLASQRPIQVQKHEKCIEIGFKEPPTRSPD